MGTRRVTLTLTEAEADALLGFACEGEVAGEDLVTDGQLHMATWKAGHRAVDQLRRLVNAVEIIDLRRQDITTMNNGVVERWWCDCHKQRCFMSGHAAILWHERRRG